jgi:hypothetical protein
VKGPVSFVGSLVSGAFAVAGAAVGSQFPAFVQQYLQRLGGYRDGLWQSLEEMARAGTPFDNPARIAIEQRFLGVDQALNELTLNTGFARLVTFLENVDREVARATANAFQPGIQLSPEGLAFAGIGLVLGVTVFHLIVGTGKSAWTMSKIAIKGKRKVPYEK